MKAYIAGYHGMKNLGDDYFLKFIIQQLQNRGYKTIYVSAIQDNLPILEYSNDFTVCGVLPQKSIIRGYGQWISMLRYALKSDVLVFCAGSIFTILPFKLINIVLFFAKLMNPKLKVLGVGISVGPFHSELDQITCNQIFTKFDALLLRDKKSLDYLDECHKNKAVVSRDIAYTYYNEKNDIEKDSSVLGIALNDYKKIFSSDLSFENERNNKLIEIVISLKQAGLLKKVKIFGTCTHELFGDLRVVEYLFHSLQEHIDTEVIIYDGNIDQFIQKLSGCGVLIASRLHAGFFAYLSGSQVIQLSYAEKVDSFYEGINHDGLIVFDAYDFEKQVIFDTLIKMHKYSLSSPHPLSRYTRETSLDINNFLDAYFSKDNIK